MLALISVHGWQATLFGETRPGRRTRGEISTSITLDFVPLRCGAPHSKTVQPTAAFFCSNVINSI